MLEAQSRVAVHGRGYYASRPHPLIVTPALRDALLAWCAAPMTRTVLGVLAEAVDRIVRHGRG